MKATDESVMKTCIFQTYKRQGSLQAGRFEYLWQDSENYKRPTKMSAPQYVEHLMAWVQSNIDNEQMFPSRIGMFTSTFCQLVVKDVKILL